MTDTNGSSIIRVPNTAADMLPPKSASLVADCANFLRAHWPEIKPYYECISGAVPSMHGSLNLDDAACVFKVQAIARENGFPSLVAVPAVKLRHALRYAYRRNLGYSVTLLEKQYKQAKLEQRRKPA
jgi:hypothetical protein